MTPEKQRIKLAEAMGWKIDRKYLEWYLINPEGITIVSGCLIEREFSAKMALEQFLPDFLNDLNAIHKAEKKLLTTGELCHEYQNHLLDLMPWNFSADADMADRWMFHRTAAERCEALLRTLNLWEEE